MRVLYIFLLACNSDKPPALSSHPTPNRTIELPEPTIDLHMADGEMLRFGSVEGYRARRRDYQGPLAILIQDDPRSETAQERARELAERPALVLVIAPDGDTASAISYLEGIPGISDVQYEPIADGAP